MGMTVFKIKWHLGAILKTIIYKMAFGKSFSLGGGTTFRSRFNVYLENGAKISIGEDCFFNHDCSINALNSVVIGNGNIFGENVKIYDHNHRFSNVKARIKDQGYATKAVVIGNRCWFGSNVTILKGVHIGDNCVVGAGTIISEDIPDNSIVMSNRGLDIKPIVQKE